MCTEQTCDCEKSLSPAYKRAALDVLSALSADESKSHPSPITEFQSLADHRIWHMSCLIHGMAPKLHTGCGNKAQTLAFDLLSCPSDPVASVDLRQSLASRVEAIEPFINRL